MTNRRREYHAFTFIAEVGRAGENWWLSYERSDDETFVCDFRHPAIPCCGADAFALGGTLESPSIAVSAASGREAKDWLGVLANKKYKFIVGDFINSTTNLYYSGNTASLNDFLAELFVVEGDNDSHLFFQGKQNGRLGVRRRRGSSRAMPMAFQHLGLDPEVFNFTIFLGMEKSMWTI